MSERLKNKRQELVRAVRSKRLANIALNMTLLEAFLIPLEPNLATVFLLIGIVALILRKLIDPKIQFRKLPFDVPVVLFVFIAFLSVFVAPDISFSFYNYYHLVIVYGLTYFLTGQAIREDKDIKTILVLMGISATLVISYGFFQYFFGIDTVGMRWVDNVAFPKLQQRIFSTWGNPNILAGYLSIVIAVTAGIMGEVKGKLKALLMTLLILALACLALTYSRGAYLTVAIILFAYWAIKDRLLLLIASTLGGVALYLNPVILGRIASIFSGTDTSAQMRLAFWDSTIIMIQDRPFLGVGWGSFFKVYPEYDYFLQGAAIEIVHPHNLYLNYIAEIGFLGAIAFFWFLFGAMYYALFISKTDILGAIVAKINDTSNASLQEKRSLIDSLSSKNILLGTLTGLGLAIISVALNGLTDHLLFNIPSSMLFWQIVALVGVIRLSLAK